MNSPVLTASCQQLYWAQVDFFLPLFEIVLNCYQSASYIANKANNKLTNKPANKKLTTKICQ